MHKTTRFSRRVAIKSAAFGLLAASLPNVFFAKHIRSFPEQTTSKPLLTRRYPAVEDAVVAEVVGKSHFNMERVQELVRERPELARASWDWAYGDWETALGAASHVGRRDIATFLIDNGARPDIFTHAMLGHFDVVKAMIASIPGIQSCYGPHGISLLQHAKAGLRMADSMTTIQKQQSEQLIAHLEQLADADPRQKHLPLTDTEKEKYLGDYRYGEGENDGLSVKLNMRKLLALGKIGTFGGALYRQASHEFEYNGVPSVKIVFEEKEGEIVSLTVHEPGLTLKAIKQ